MRLTDDLKKKMIRIKDHVSAINASVTQIEEILDHADAELKKADKNLSDQAEAIYAAK